MRNKVICLFSFLFFAGIGASYAQKPPETQAEFEKAYQWRIRQEYLYGVYIPKDLTDAFIRLNQLIEEEDRLRFKAMPEDVAIEKLFFSFGRWITHNWGFYGGSRLSDYIKNLGITYPDDMAKFIIITYHRNLNRSPLDVKNLIIQLQEERQAEYKAKLETGTILHEETRKREAETKQEGGR